MAVHYQIGLSLAGFDFKKYQARIVAEFKAAAAGPPRTAYEKENPGTRRRASIADGFRRDAFDTRVRKYQGFPD